MSPTFKKKLIRLLYWMLLLFLALFVFRLIYGYVSVSNENPTENHFFNNDNSYKRNYASKEYKGKANNPAQTAITVDQKFEKIAEILTKSSNFEEEERITRNQIEQNNGLIQVEQKRGNEGNRVLNLRIGVPPEHFDSLYARLCRIGKVSAKQITKTDKTNEYSELNAKKASLEKTRTSLVELKSKGGKIEEYINLENRILDIEQQLQELGVSLGNFDENNEFCTVQFSLTEGKDVKIGVLQRIKVALEWTVIIYLQILAIVFLATFFAYLLLLVIEKLKLVERIVNGK